MGEEERKGERNSGLHVSLLTVRATLTPPSITLEVVRSQAGQAGFRLTSQLRWVLELSLVRMGPSQTRALYCIGRPHGGDVFRCAPLGQLSGPVPSLRARFPRLS